MDTTAHRPAPQHDSPSRWLPAVVATVALLLAVPTQAAPREAALAAVPATAHGGGDAGTRSTLSDAFAGLLLASGLGAFVYARRRNARLDRERSAPAQRIDDGAPSRPRARRRLPAPGNTAPADPREPPLAAERGRGAAREAAPGAAATGTGWSVMSPLHAAEPAAGYHAVRRPAPPPPR